MNAGDSLTGNNKILFGVEGAEGFVREFIDLDGYGRPLFLVTGRQSYESSGAASFLRPIFADREVVRFYDFSVNPKMEDLGHVLEAFKASKAHLLIAVGGGSTIDLAKLINYFAATGIDPTNYTKGEKCNIEAFWPLLAVPTTAGTGSEATHFAVLYNGFKKISVADGRMAPSHIWLNPRFTISMSSYLTACTGFDAFAQAIESYWAVGSTKESRQDSAKAIKLCLAHLEKAVMMPTLEHRANMLQAAYLSGKAINVSKTTAAHALSYALTAHYGLPHGHAVAMTLPAVFEANTTFTEKDVCDPRGVEHLHTIITEICELFEVDSVQEVVQRIRDIVTNIGLSDSWLSEHDFEPKEAREYITQEVNYERLWNNPRSLNGKMIDQIVSHIK